MLDITCAPTEHDGQRHGHGDQPCILAGEEGSQEIRVGLGDQRNPVPTDEAGSQHAPRQGLGLLLQFPIGDRFQKVAARRIELRARIANTAKRIYRTLELDGYARIDFRLSADNVPYFLEANPNPEIAEGDEFAAAAEHDGLTYAAMLHRIVALGLSRARAIG